MTNFPEKLISQLLELGEGDGELAYILETKIKEILEKVGCLGKVDFLIKNIVCRQSSSSDSRCLTIHTKFCKREEISSSSSLFTSKFLMPTLDKSYNMLTTNYEVSNIAIHYHKHDIFQVALEEMCKCTADELLKACGTSLNQEYETFHKKLIDAQSNLDFMQQFGYNDMEMVKAFKRVAKRIKLGKRKLTAPWGF